MPLWNFSFMGVYMKNDALSQNIFEPESFGMLILFLIYFYGAIFDLKTNEKRLPEGKRLSFFFARQPKPQALFARWGQPSARLADRTARAGQAGARLRPVHAAAGESRNQDERFAVQARARASRRGDVARVVGGDRSGVLRGRRATSARAHAGDRAAGDQRQVDRRAGDAIAGRCANRDGGASRSRGEHDFRELRLRGVVVVCRDCDGGQDADDRDNDHEFDEGETFLCALQHCETPCGGWVREIAKCSLTCSLSYTAGPLAIAAHPFLSRFS